MAKSESELAAKMPASVAQAAAAVPAKRKTLEDLFVTRREQFEQALARSMPFERFIRVLITKVSTNKTLMDVARENPGSLLGACLEMAQTGLDPAIPNECHLVPYGDKIVHQVGYKGLAKMAMEAAKQFSYPLEVLNSEVVYENDIFERTMGSNPSVVHKAAPLGQPRGKPIAFCATSKDSNGMINCIVMTWDEMRQHYIRYCKAKNNSKSMWYNCFTDSSRTDDNSLQYGLKTVTRLLINRFLPMSAKLTDVINSDSEETPFANNTLALETELQQRDAEVSQPEAAEPAATKQAEAGTFQSIIAAANI